MTKFDKILIMLGLSFILLMQAETLTQITRTCAAQIDTLQDTVLDGETDYHGVER